jgi:anaerobic selenocysteine-containing dehydrogenase
VGRGARSRRARAPRGPRRSSYASGRSSNEATFLFQLVARAYGSANVHNCSFYCHSASGVALGQVYGPAPPRSGSTISAAPTSCSSRARIREHHRASVPQLVGLRRRGGKVIVVNRCASSGSSASRAVRLA